MKEIKISIRTDKEDELAIISDIKRLLKEKHDVLDNNIIHRTKIIPGGSS